jgi:hypothetical protein
MLLWCQKAGIGFNRSVEPGLAGGNTSLSVFAGIASVAES